MDNDVTSTERVLQTTRLEHIFEVLRAIGIIIMSLEKSNMRYFTQILTSLINKVKSCKHHIYIKYSNILSCIMSINRVGKFNSFLPMITIEKKSRNR